MRRRAMFQAVTGAGKRIAPGAAAVALLSPTAALVQAPVAPPAPTPAELAASTAQPAGAACAAGGKYVADPYAPAPAFPQQTRAPRIPASRGYTVQSLARDVRYGRSMAFLPDGRMLLAEREGRLRLMTADGQASAPIAGLPPLPEPSGLIGLMDVAVDPGFAANRRLYFSYVTPAPPPPGAPPPAAFGRPPDGIGHIASARLSAAGDRLEAFKVLYEGSRVRRVLSRPGGVVFFTTVAGDREGPQTLVRDSGKVMRIASDGAALKDNPFARRADVGRLAYDLGHRDPDGLAADARGRIWTVEHGPRGGDELNLIRPGRNYGYPIISYGREYSGDKINDDASVRDGLEQPVYYWTPDIAPSGLMIYSGAMFPQWRGDVFLGGLVAQSLIRLRLDRDRVVGEEFLLADRCRRIRDVREGSDGAIYVLTDGDAGEVLRIVSEGPLPGRRR